MVDAVVVERADPAAAFPTGVISRSCDVCVALHVVESAFSVRQARSRGRCYLHGLSGWHA